MTDNEPEYGASHVITITVAEPQPSLLGDRDGWIVDASCACRWRWVPKGKNARARWATEGAARVPAEAAAAGHRKDMIAAEIQAARRAEVSGQVRVV